MVYKDWFYDNGFFPVQRSNIEEVIDKIDKDLEWEEFLIDLREEEQNYVRDLKCRITF